MKVFVAYNKECKFVPEVKKALELMGHEVILPNYYHDSSNIHESSFQEDLKMMSAKDGDVTLVLNSEMLKNGIIYDNYIGGSTFLEIHDSYMLGHDIYLYNDIPSGSLHDDIERMKPIVLNGNLLKLKEDLDKKEGKKIC